ncbi:hypothetical protein THRCLA_09509 [Thraustotheca clavata]|uniref:F-box/LRR-repeat protein 15-like leucin rich repeat domain-containing protein n=1 Tax=Thraustotheca clavata TaxID=74557 RepID=A0A1V9YWB4_9STRA|nr:hypothetical protein THRCLA_09509 [Thraustotheca clavata]
MEKSRIAVNRSKRKIEKIGKPVHNAQVCCGNQQLVAQVIASSLESLVLDTRPVANSIDDPLLVEIATQLSKSKARITSFVLCNCPRVSPVGIRAIAHAIGSDLKHFSYANSNVDRSILKVLATRLECLEDLDFSECPTLAAEAIREFIPCCNRIMRRCDLSNCPSITDDAICWLSGTIGTQGSLTRCVNLLSLNLAQTKAITDRGLTSLAIGCGALQFLNLEGLVNITDIGMQKLTHGCKRLRVVHLKKCIQLTDETLKSLGEHCHKLQSINLCGCIAISNIGLAAMVEKTKALQVVDVQGCNLLTEQALCILVKALPALQRLNVSGCQQITENGLLTLAAHLPFVQSATSFRGLEPRINAKELKFMHHQKTIAQSAALRIQSWFRGHIGRTIAKSWRCVMIETPAVNRIRRAFLSHCLRNEINFRARKKRKINLAAARIQGLVRGFLLRAKYYRELEESYLHSIQTRAAKRIQSRFRGFLIRRQPTMVNMAIRRMYFRFEEDKRIRCAVRVQRCYRNRLNQCRFLEVVYITQRRREQCNAAAIKLQRLFRSRAARALTRSLRQELESKREWKKHCITMAIKLQSHWRRHATWRHIQHARQEHHRRQRIEYEAATKINALGRGWLGRRLAASERENLSKKHAAAKCIQRAWQHYLHPSHGTIEYKKLVSDIQWQIHLENAQAEQRKEELLEKQRKAAMHDSASEADSEDDWYAFEDGAYWFSPSRNEKEYTRPNRFAREKSMVGLPIKVFWPLEDAWFEGLITKFCASRLKHKIVYLDGDTEWLDLEAMDATYLRLFLGSWMMYENYCPSEVALKAALFVHVRFQLYSVEYFCWRSGWIDSFDATHDVFRLIFDDDATQMVEMDLFAMEDEVQVQDKRSLLWYHPAAFFFGDGYDVRIYDYLTYIPPTETQEPVQEEYTQEAWNTEYYEEFTWQETQEEGEESAAIAEEEVGPTLPMEMTQANEEEYDELSDADEEQEASEDEDEEDEEDD